MKQFLLDSILYVETKDEVQIVDSLKVLIAYTKRNYTIQDKPTIHKA